MADWRIEWGSGLRGAKRRFVRKGADSPKETRLRMLLVLAGLPEPTVNLIIRNPDGGWRMRFDLSYPGLKLIIEYDGRQHAESSGQWRRDLSRREELDRLGWRLIVVTSMIFATRRRRCSTGYERPSSIVVRLASAAASRLNGILRLAAIV